MHAALTRGVRRTIDEDRFPHAPRSSAAQIGAGEARPGVGVLREPFRDQLVKGELCSGRGDPGAALVLVNVLSERRCRPVAPVGVIEAPRVKLRDGLFRTIDKSTSAPTAPALYSTGHSAHSFIQGGSAPAGGELMSDRWEAELKVLTDLVEHHVNEEESTGFSCARDEFDKEQLEAMREEFQTRKAQLGTQVG